MPKHTSDSKVPNIETPRTPQLHVRFEMFKHERESTLIPSSIDSPDRDAVIVSEDYQETDDSTTQHLPVITSAVPRQCHVPSPSPANTVDEHHETAFWADQDQYSVTAEINSTARPDDAGDDKSPTCKP